MEDIGVTIRGYTREDREDIRRISWETAFLREPPENFLDDREIMEDVLTIYFTDYEPDSCFVAVYANKVIGYVIGALSVKVLWRVLTKKIIPQLIVKALRRGVFIKRNSRRFLFYTTLSLLKGEFSIPDFSGQYPATFHINIDKKFRGHGLGTRMVEYYLDFLKTKMVRGVHLGTMSESARHFFSRLGFSLLFEGRRSHLKYILKKKVYYYVLGNILRNE